MRAYKAIENEVNKIRFEIYEEIKDLSQEQRNQRLRAIVESAQYEFGFKRIASAKNHLHKEK